MNIKIENLPIESKIGCIKIARSAFAGDHEAGHMGLREAKEAVEAVKPINGKITMTGQLNPLIKDIKELNSIMDHDVRFKDVKISNISKYIPIKSEGTQLFSVPNTEDGKAFLEQAKLYLNRPQYSLRSRGRGSRTKHGDQYSIPIKHAEWLAVYLKNENDRNQMVADSEERSRYEKQLREQKLLINDLNDTIESLQLSNTALDTSNRNQSIDSKNWKMAHDQMKEYTTNLEDKSEKQNEYAKSLEYIKITLDKTLGSIS